MEQSNREEEKTVGLDSGLSGSKARLEHFCSSLKSILIMPVRWQPYLNWSFVEFLIKKATEQGQK